MKKESTNPLHYFELLIEYNGIKKSYESFLLDIEMLDGWFIKKSKTIFQYVVTNEYGERILHEESFENKLNPKFNLAYEHFIVNTSEVIGSIATTKEKKETLIFYLENLKYLLTIATKSNFIVDFQKFFILKAARYLSIKFKPLLQEHDIYNLIKVEEYSLGYFGFKGGRDDLEKLFNTLVQLSLFSDEIAFKQFREIIYSDAPQKLNIKIPFNCSLQVAATIIENIQTHFFNLTNISIAASKCFLTLQGKEITSNGIYSARSKFRNNLLNADRIKEIRKSLRKLKIQKR